ncbi:MAG: primosomal protein N' [Cytophagales bacterium]|nr:MAG: primosomal protein N' [Cytophagales bacterium]TAF61972.1 MAG: primosomal protein N' [Cytophagales bacterium]
MLDAQQTTLYVDVILPLPLPATFTYRLPFELNNYIRKGTRVMVQFGRRRVMTALVVSIHSNPPQDYAAKYVLELLDEHPILLPLHLDFWQWTAEYYLCYIGEVMNVALPSALKLSSTTRIEANPDFENLPQAQEAISDKEQLILDTLKTRGTLTLDDIFELVDQKNIHKLLKSLISREAIITFEEVKEKYKPKYIKKVRLAQNYVQRHALQELLVSLANKPKQERVLLRYLSLVPVLDNPALNSEGAPKNAFVDKHMELAEQISFSSLQTMLKNGIFEEFSEHILRQNQGAVEAPRPALTPEQAVVRDEILTHFQTKSAVLLHGVTGSGKTEVYIDLIMQALAGGSQVLLLLPEIALTTQMVIRLRKIFGNKMGVYHSRLTENERYEIWQGVKDGLYDFVLAVRSGIFLPFYNLNLIIIDEEHDSSYKQYEPSPRYNARDLAMVLASMHKGKVLLGSATPSLESYFLAQKGQYGLVKLLVRYSEAKVPRIELIDLKEARQQKQMREQFTLKVLSSIETAIERQEQVILFQNRRGFAPYLECEVCNWVPRCINCSVSLTYHQKSNEIRCHYCGHHEHTPKECKSCKSHKVSYIGYGTEKLEEDLTALLPTVRTLRMDRDTTHTKHQYEQVIQDFDEGKADVLVGTQMVTKGLDFARVNLVCVFDMDRFLHFPDFRALERAFQLLVQVSGRAGRRSGLGHVLIQTSQPQHPVFKKVIENDYLSFFDQELLEREKYSYPPFARVVRLTLKHEDLYTCKNAALDLAAPLLKQWGQEVVLGPERPLIDRIKNRYLQDILLKFPRSNFNLKAAKIFLRAEVEKLLSNKSYKKLSMVLDVDFV